MFCAGTQLGRRTPCEAGCAWHCWGAARCAVLHSWRTGCSSPPGWDRPACESAGCWPGSRDRPWTPPETRRSSLRCCSRPAARLVWEDGHRTCAVLSSTWRRAARASTRSGNATRGPATAWCSRSSYEENTEGEESRIIKKAKKLSYSIAFYLKKQQKSYSHLSFITWKRDDIL